MASRLGSCRQSGKYAILTYAIAKRYDSPFFKSVETPENTSFVLILVPFYLSPYIPASVDLPQGRISHLLDVTNAP